MCMVLCAKADGSLSARKKGVIEMATSGKRTKKPYEQAKKERRAKRKQIDKEVSEMGVLKHMKKKD